MASSLVSSGLFENVMVVGGGSLAKMGMKFRGHLASGYPIMEDVLGAFALMVSADDGVNPVVRLDGVGRHKVKSGSSPQQILEALVVEPLERLGLRMTDVPKYALELHNPEVTEPAGSGDVPRNNYRALAGMAVIRRETDRSGMDRFEASHGMPGFSPTQGHVPASLPFMGHARDRILSGELERAMFIAKGSLFLGKMTGLSDGMSFLVERNGDEREGGR
jgi:betaine reductase